MDLNKGFKDNKEKQPELESEFFALVDIIVSNKHL